MHHMPPPVAEALQAGSLDPGGKGGEKELVEGQALGADEELAGDVIAEGLTVLPVHGAWGREGGAPQVSNRLMFVARPPCLPHTGSGPRGGGAVDSEWREGP